MDYLPFSKFAERSTTYVLANIYIVVILYACTPLKTKVLIREKIFAKSPPGRIIC
nr:MAG TPA: hypothetical protein [Caudoviricetes sp.]